MSYIDNQNSDYKSKYLKYKTKYLGLKQQQLQQQGGGSKNNNKITISLFKADWCGHCNSFKDTWNDMNNKYGNKYKFVTYDSEKNQKEIKESRIQGYPTIIISNNEKSIEYHSDRTEQSILEFINTYFK
jgi:thiol-disulfide isomerase/thioredoxin